MQNWEFHDIGFEGQTEKVEGVDIWKHKWQSSEHAKFEAPHPQHSTQFHIMRPFILKTGGRQINFAASEVSNMVWCIYVLK